MSRLGIDLGGTKVALRVDGPSPYQTVFRWPAGSADARADWAELAARVRALPVPVERVGVALPATLDRDGRVVAWPTRPSWTGLDVSAELAALFPDAVVRHGDDGDLAAVAEAAAAGVGDLVYLGVGTGVGGGIVLDGRPVPGPEPGHLVIDRSGPRCDCGRHGCLQSLASGPATLRRATELRGDDDAPPVSPDALHAGLAASALWARRAVDETAEALATAVIGVAELLHPALVVIGGGFAAGLPFLPEAVAAHARRLSRPGAPAPRVREAALGALSSLHGAVLLARRTP